MELPECNGRTDRIDISVSRSMMLMHDKKKTLHQLQFVVKFAS